VLIVNLGGEGENIVAVNVPPGSKVVHVNPLDYGGELVMAPVRTGASKTRSGRATSCFAGSRMTPACLTATPTSSSLSPSRSR